MAAANKSASAQESAAKQQAKAMQQGGAGFLPYQQSGGYANEDLNILMGMGGNETEESLMAKYAPEYTSRKKIKQKSGGGVFGKLKKFDDTYDLGGRALGIKGQGGKGKFKTSFDEAGLRARVQKELAAQEARKKDPRYGMLTKQFTGQDLQNEPGYQFRFNQGSNALQGGLAAKGGLFSGAAGKALTQYGQDFGSNEFQNAYSRDMANKQNLYNMYSGIKSSGQNAAGGMANQFNALGDVYGTMGANRAAGYMGQANALAGGIDSGMNYWSQKQAAKKV